MRWLGGPALDRAGLRAVARSSGARRVLDSAHNRPTGSTCATPPPNSTPWATSEQNPWRVLPESVLGAVGEVATVCRSTRASGGIGRRAGFRCQYSQGCGGSSPPSPTYVHWQSPCSGGGFRRFGPLVVPGLAPEVAPTVFRPASDGGRLVRRRPGATLMAGRRCNERGERHGSS